MDSILKVFFLAMVPVGELRLSLPTAITIYNLDWQTAFFISFLGNIVPVVLILLFLGPASKYLSGRSAIMKKGFDWVFERTRKKSGSKIERAGEATLVGFVAIPLPFTGAWTGAIAAFLFNIPFKRAFPLISLGVFISGIIVLFLTTLGLWII
ncbi:MAG: hypothetical protein A2365_03660 [Candidatus Nealsonbacteria bacterium RIFOXYB1_FULL_40_15]|uniref:Ligand-binding protein SH3 n=2 Tax=Candidatus Nealsoniibacteriota TaxID=1817911 RepID=A0A1G2ERM8_9BACT|nr:MAG: hypothetical protein A2365_03660 [Candidatus Nealsonbacteria bacterium RIFOXYB1_FULL_40_15]OGZ28397.1 MAG: hypothetical protein A2427_01345 [Candidatus Nealsonbacteria bacterium RIFOXYC1_FULL_40_7]OGZ29523.1 MAG: hypothetical protein A2562_02430 [Candidatus Nealsonbacteria bacterium RIFOXYD1_FULL_39_11]